MNQTKYILTFNKNQSVFYDEKILWNGLKGCFENISLLSYSYGQKSLKMQRRILIIQFRHVANATVYFGKGKWLSLATSDYFQHRFCNYDFGFQGLLTGNTVTESTTQI